MNKELVKQAYSEAENSLKEKQVEEVKKIVLKTLEKIESLKNAKESAKSKVEEIDEQIKVLKMDIDDLKEGRLDRIEERQAKDEKAKETSVVIIIKETRVEHDYPWWYWPYRVIWQEQPIYNPPIYYCGTSSVGTTWSNCDTICASNAKWGTSGAYTLTSGTVNIR